MMKQNEIITISSQRYRNEDTVEAKRASKDYTVTVSPAFEIDGDMYRVVINGHHAYEAAKRDGVEPVWYEATQQDDDRVGMLEDGAVDDYLAANWMDADWYNVETGRNVF